MKHTLSTLFILALSLPFPVIGRQNATNLIQLRKDGAFGFPQQFATVLCDRPDLTVSVSNNDSWLYLQAILWEDNNSDVGKLEGERDVSDYSSLMFHSGEGEVRTPRKDRNYYLNPLPSMKGFYYTIMYDNSSSTGLKKDSRGQGAIRYVRTYDGDMVRIDSFLIPLAELERKPGDSVQLCYYAFSPSPRFTTHSSSAKSVHVYFDYHIPVSAYHTQILEVEDTSKVNWVLQ